MFDGWYGMTDTNAQAESAQKTVRLDQISEQIEKYFEGLELSAAMGGQSAGLKKSEKAEILGTEFLGDADILGKRAVTLDHTRGTATLRGSELQKFEARRTLDQALRKSPSIGIAEAMQNCYEDFADLADEDEDRQIQQAIAALDVACYLDLLSGLYARSVEPVTRPRTAPLAAY